MFPLAAIMCALILFVTIQLPGGLTGPGATVLAIASLAIVPTWLYERGGCTDSRNPPEETFLGGPIPVQEPIR